jgi:hypothetical protein
MWLKVPITGRTPARRPVAPFYRGDLLLDRFPLSQANLGSEIGFLLDALDRRSLFGLDADAGSLPALLLEDSDDSTPIYGNRLTAANVDRHGTFHLFTRLSGSDPADRA